MAGRKRVQGLLPRLQGGCDQLGLRKVCGTKRGTGGGARAAGRADR